MNFVTDCINRILELYKFNQNVKSVVLMGHSMGGFVARSAFKSPSYVPGTIRTIITIDSPHKTVPILLSSEIEYLYSIINQFWREECQTNEELKNVVTVSMSGGFKDIQVHAGLSNLDFVSPCTQNHFTVLSSSIQEIWISLDHNSCFWCYQMALVVNSALVSILDEQTKQPYLKPEQRISKLKQVLISNVPSSLYLNSPILRKEPPCVMISSKNKYQLKISNQSESNQNDQNYKKNYMKWIKNLKYQENTTVRLKGSELNSFSLKWNIFYFAPSKQLNLFTSLPKNTFNVFLCHSEVEECLDLTENIASVPYKFLKNGFGFIPIKFQILSVQFKQYNTSDGYQNLILTNRFQNKFYQETSQDFLISEINEPNNELLSNSFLPQIIDLKPSLLTNISLISPSKFLIQKVQIRTLNCNSSSFFSPFLFMYSYSMNEERYGTDYLSLRFHEDFFIDKNASQNDFHQIYLTYQKQISLFIFTDPVCEYKSEFKIDWISSMDAYFRNYIVLVLGGTFVMTIMSFSQQIKISQNYYSRQYASIVDSQIHLLFSIWIPVFVFIASIPIYFDRNFQILSPILSQHSFFNMILPWPSPFALLVIFTISFSIVSIWSILSKKLLKNRISKKIIKFSCFNFFKETKNSCKKINSEHKRTSSVEILLNSWPGTWCWVRPKAAFFTITSLVLITFISHSLIAFCISVFLLLYPIDDTIEDRIFHLKHGIFILYSPLFIIMVPNFLVWFKNLNFKYELFDSFEVLIILISLHITLINHTTPKVLFHKSMHHLPLILSFLSSVVILYGLFHIYINNFIYSLLVSILIIDHIFKIIMLSLENENKKN